MWACVCAWVCFGIWVLQIISPSECVLFVFQSTKGFWSLVYFHAKSSAESRGCTSSGKPVEFSPGMLSEKQNKKLYSAQKLTSTLPNQTQEFATYFLEFRLCWALGVFCFFAYSLFCNYWKLDLILLGFPWFSSMITVIFLNKGQLSHWLGKGEKHLFFWWQ